MNMHNVFTFIMRYYYYRTFRTRAFSRKEQKRTKIVAERQ